MCLYIYVFSFLDKQMPSIHMVRHPAFLHLIFPGDDYNNSV